MITALSLYVDFEPVKKESYTKTGNPFYDSWVFLDDDANQSENSKTTFEKMLMIDDINTESNTESLLNTKPIDNIANQIFDRISKEWESDKIPKFISKDFRILITISSLRPLDCIVELSRLKSKYICLVLKYGYRLIIDLRC